MVTTRTFFIMLPAERSPVGPSPGRAAWDVSSAETMENGSCDAWRMVPTLLPASVAKRSAAARQGADYKPCAHGYKTNFERFNSR